MVYTRPQHVRRLCTHTTLQVATLATTMKPSDHHTHLHATSLWLKHTWRLCCGHWAATGEQAPHRPATGTHYYCKEWWWRSLLLGRRQLSLSLRLPSECGSGSSLPARHRWVLEVEATGKQLCHAVTLFILGVHAKLQ